MSCSLPQLGGWQLRLRHHHVSRFPAECVRASGGRPSVKAIAPGRIYHHSCTHHTKGVCDRGPWGGDGDGEAVYEHLDWPAVIPQNGRRYDNVYYAEQHSLVEEGDWVTIGQPVMIAGGDELGFARENTNDPNPIAPEHCVDPSTGKPTNCKNAHHTLPTPEGRDFQNFLLWIQNVYLKQK